MKWVQVTTVQFNETMNTTTTTPLQPHKHAFHANSELVSLKLNSISYIKNGMKYIIKDLKLEQTTSSTLTLQKVIVEDSGTYTCVVSNRFGTVRKSAKLTVEPGESRENLLHLFYVLYTFFYKQLGIRTNATDGI